MMIYKVFYQPTKDEIPVRENTDVLYLEAESEKEVRMLLKDRPYNIEFITPLTGKALEYEQKSEKFKLENV